MLHNSWQLLESPLGQRIQREQQKTRDPLLLISDGPEFTRCLAQGISTSLWKDRIGRFADIISDLFGRDRRSYKWRYYGLYVNADQQPPRDRVQERKIDGWVTRGTLQVDLVCLRPPTLRSSNVKVPKLKGRFKVCVYLNISAEVKQKGGVFTLSFECSAQARTGCTGKAFVNR